MCPDCPKKLTFKNSFILLSVFSIVFLASKSFASGTSGKIDHSKMNHSERKVVDEKSKKAVLDVLKSNEELHKAFFKYDGKKAEEKAGKLKSAIEKIGNKEISKLLEFSKSKLDMIKATNEREANNQNYHLVSSALIHVVNTFDLGSEYNAYSCPMVKKKWIQNTTKSAEVENPYAANMPSCGSKDSEY